MSLSPQSQLILRNIEQFESGSWLIINADDPALFSALSTFKLTALHQYFSIYSQATGQHAAISFASEAIVADPSSLTVSQQVNNHRHVFAPTLDSGEFTDVLIFMPKAKAQLSMLMAMASTLCGNGGRVHLIGENRGGIKSAGKLLSPYGSVIKVDSARHCSWLTCHIEHAPDSFSLHTWSAVETYSHNNLEWQVYSLPGVFSHRELDQGTALLLSALPTQLKGNVLDFACGAGVIASFLKCAKIATHVDLLDVSALALVSSAHTLDANGLQGKLIAADTLNGVNQHYQNIVSNPPFHTGVKTDYSVTREFINSAKHLLSSPGQLVVVANRFLPYAEILQDAFSQPKLLAQDTRFSVHSVQR